MKIETSMFGKEENVEIPSVIYDEFKKQKEIGFKEEPEWWNEFIKNKTEAEQLEEWAFDWQNGTPYIAELIDDFDGKIIDKDLAEFLIRYETETELRDGGINSFNKQMEFKIGDFKIKIHAFGQNNDDEGLASLHLMGYKI